MAHPIRARRTRASTALTLVLVITLSAGCMQDASREPVATNEVRIPGAWVFEPEVIEISNGTTVTWTNDGGQAHTVTFASLGIDETIASGDTWAHTFEAPGTYDYTCRFHPPDMEGRVIVRAPSGEEE